MSRTCSNCFQPLPEGVEVCPACGYDQRKDQGNYPLALPVGTVLNGRYILGRVLGQGGFGITYVAKDHRTGGLVAVKEYFPDTMATRSQGPAVTAYTGQREENFSYGKECFLNEAKTLAEFIGNPNIVRVYSYFEENHTAYFVMEYVQGISLQEYLKERGRIPWQEAKRILFPVMEALEAVHAKGIVHRDVTPDNIYLTRDGQVKLLDFGAARYSLGDKSRSLDVVLKHGFAPKEQYSRHGRQGPFTDVYALGATFYFAITGRVPPDSIDRQDEDDLILPSSLGVKIPVGVEDALCKALAVSAQDRFQTMGEFQLALSRGELDAGEVPPPQPPSQGTGGETDFGTGGDGTVPPQPPERGGGGAVSSGELTPEKKKRLQIVIGAVAALFVVVTLSVLAASMLGKAPSAVPGDFQTSESGVSSSVEEGENASQQEDQVVSLEDGETVRLRTRLYSFDDQGVLEEVTLYEFDGWGNEVGYADYLPDGSLESYSRKVYDSSGRKIEETHFEADGTMTSRYEDLYEGNTLQEYSWREGEERVLDGESTFDDAGNQLTLTSYNDDGSVDYTREYEYDSQGNLVYKNFGSYQEGSLESLMEYQYSYDSQGNQVEEQTFRNGELYQVTQWEFDGNGNMLFEYEYDKTMALQYASKFQYDSQGNQIFDGWYDKEGDLRIVYENEYDQYGECVLAYSDTSPEDPEEDDASLFTYENQYDEEGNLVREIAYCDGVLWCVREYETRTVPAQPGGDPDLELAPPEGEITVDAPQAPTQVSVDKSQFPKTKDAFVSPAAGSSTPEPEVSQAAQSGEFTGSQHGITGAKFAIQEIQGQEGFAGQHSGSPCGGLVEMEDGPWFLALYERSTGGEEYAVYYSLYDLRGNGLVVPACEELFVPVGGNNGKVGIYQDKEGVSYLMVERRQADGQTVYTSYSYTPITADGLTLEGSCFGSSEVNYDKGTEVYIVGDTKTDESGFQDFQNRFTPVCSMDLFGSYVGNVITFEDFLQNYG